MKSYLKEFYEEFDYPEEARAALDEAYDTITADKARADAWADILRAYDESGAINFNDIKPICEEISEASGVHQYTVKLLIHICLTKRLKARYEEEGYPYELWFGAALDFKWKLIECHIVHGIWGTFVADGNWFSRWYDLTRFAIGRLQFETIKFNKEYEKDGKKLTKDSKVINVHIPRTGTSLNHELVLKSYASAKEFYKKEFGDEPIAFYCSSWMLFPEQANFLNERSNVLKFMLDYDPLTSGIFPEENKSALWRIFDCPITDDIASLPEDSFLKQAYKKYLLGGGKLGFGSGVFFA